MGYGLRPLAAHFFLVFLTGFDNIFGLLGLKIKAPSDIDRAWPPADISRQKKTHPRRYQQGKILRPLSNIHIQNQHTYIDSRRKKRYTRRFRPAAEISGCNWIFPSTIYICKDFFMLIVRDVKKFLPVKINRKRVLVSVEINIVKNY